MKVILEIKAGAKQTHTCKNIAEVLDITMSLVRDNYNKIKSGQAKLTIEQ